MTDYVVIMTTAGGKDEAQKIAKELVAAEMAACVQIFEIHSFYMWKGSATNEPEQLMLIKTRTAHKEAVQERILELHSYETPEIIVLPVIEGSASYLAWIDSVTGGSQVVGTSG